MNCKFIYWGFFLLQNIHGLTNGGFHWIGSLRSTECRSEGPFHPHGERGPGEGPFHIEDRGDSHHTTLEQPYRGDPLPLYPEMENARGKVNIVIFSGKHFAFFNFNVGFLQQNTEIIMLPELVKDVKCFGPCITIRNFIKENQFFSVLKMENNFNVL